MPTMEDHKAYIYGTFDVDMPQSNFGWNIELSARVKSDLRNMHAFHIECGPVCITGFVQAWLKLFWCLISSCLWLAWLDYFTQIWKHFTHGNCYKCTDTTQTKHNHNLTWQVWKDDVMYVHVHTQVQDFRFTCCLLTWSGDYDLDYLVNLK